MLYEDKLGTLTLLYGHKYIHARSTHNNDCLITSNIMKCINRHVALIIGKCFCVHCILLQKSQVLKWNFLHVGMPSRIPQRVNTSTLTTFVDCIAEVFVITYPQTQHKYNQTSTAQPQSWAYMYVCIYQLPTWTWNTECTQKCTLW